MNDSSFVSSETLSATARLERILSIVHGDAPPATPVRPSPRGEPYAVEQYPGVSDTVNLVGRDGRGDIMLEMRIARAKVSERMRQRMIRWLKEHDDGSAPLTLV